MDDEDIFDEQVASIVLASKATGHHPVENVDARREFRLLGHLGDRERQREHLSIAATRNRVAELPQRRG